MEIINVAFSVKNLLSSMVKSMYQKHMRNCEMKLNK